jgi:putative ABC transport system ATP-binding protein
VRRGSRGPWEDRRQRVWFITVTQASDVLRLVEVVKTYAQGDAPVRALAGISLDVARGEFVSVMGPSGSGKSTLLHVMGGLDRADGGDVWVDGQRLADLDDDAVTLLRRREIGFVFQFFNLLPTLTARENVALPLLLDGVPRREAERRGERMLERVGLLTRRQHRPHELSGGEMQRVAIARALVIEPSVLLADEPTGNLDSRTGGDILTLLAEAVGELGQTIVMVTHDPRAAACSSRVLRLRDGAVVDDTAGVTAGIPARP